MIDVKQLMHVLTDADLLASADAYFAGLNEHSEQVKKPFSNPGDATHITRHLGWVLEAAELFAGAEVLDFGCATGWLTLGLASMGCDAVGVDIAPSAIALARELKDKRWGGRDGSVAFHVYDGHRLPLADASLDRIICFDAFHHVKDQAGTLAEFARVLRPGGRAALLEPGPNHSKTAQSQREMSMYKVIENDISMPEVQRLALAAGFTDVEMFVQMQMPRRMPYEQFQRWADQGMSTPEVAEFMQTLREQMTNTQCFALRKGAAVHDSRSVAALGARLSRVEAAAPAPAGFAAVRLRVENTGTGHWLHRPGARGHVNLGAQRMAADGHVDQVDFMRFDLPGTGLAPGQSAEIEVQLPHTAGTPLRLRFDLVSELVAWFGTCGAAEPLDVVL